MAGGEAGVHVDGEIVFAAQPVEGGDVGEEGAAGFEDAEKMFERERDIDPALAEEIAGEDDIDGGVGEREGVHVAGEDGEVVGRLKVAEGGRGVVERDELHAGRDAAVDVPEVGAGAAAGVEERVDGGAVDLPQGVGEH